MSADGRTAEHAGFTERRRYGEGGTLVLRVLRRDGDPATALVVARGQLTPESSPFLEDCLLDLREGRDGAVRRIVFDGVALTQVTSNAVEPLVNARQAMGEDSFVFLGNSPTLAQVFGEVGLGGFFRAVETVDGGTAAFTRDSRAFAGTDAPPPDTTTRIAREVRSVIKSITQEAAGDLDVVGQVDEKPDTVSITRGDTLSREFEAVTGALQRLISSNERAERILTELASLLNEHFEGVQNQASTLNRTLERMERTSSGPPRKAVGVPDGLLDTGGDANLANLRDEIRGDLVRPLLMDMIELHDTLGDLITVAESEGERKRALAIQSHIQDKLERHRVVPLPAPRPGSSLDAELHRAGAEKETAIAAEHRKVAGLERPGFRWEHHLLRPHVVTVYRFRGKTRGDQTGESDTATTLNDPLRSALSNNDASNRTRTNPSDVHPAG